MTRKRTQIILIGLVGLLASLTILSFSIAADGSADDPPLNLLRLETHEAYLRITDAWPMDAAGFDRLLTTLDGQTTVTLVDLTGQVLLSSREGPKTLHMQEAFYMDQSYAAANPGVYKLTVPVSPDNQVAGFVIFEKRMVENAAPSTTGLRTAMALVVVLIIALSFYNLFFTRHTELEDLESGLTAISRGILKNKPLPSDSRFHSVYQTYNRLVDELRDVMKKQQNFEVQRKSFLTMISHELKTPIATISAYIEGLSSGVAKDEETRQRYQRIIDEKMKQLTVQVDNFFKYAQEDEGRFKYHFEECYADEVLSKIFEDLLITDGPKTHIENLLPACLISIDRVRIEQVILNIYNNAVKHTTAEDAIILRGYREEDDVVIEISDTGEGIHAKDLPYIFDYYYQGQDSQKSDYEGVGLGLAICKDIIDHHQGLLRVRSNRGEGTTLYIKLPVL